MPPEAGGLSPSERDIEDLARTVACPNCGAAPLKPCISWRTNGSRFPIPVAHTGRLLAARAVAL